MVNASDDLTPCPPRGRLHEMARTLDKMLNKPGQRETGFLLLVFPGSGAEGGRTEIASNSGDLGALVGLLRDMARRLEKWNVPMGNA